MSPRSTRCRKRPLSYSQFSKLPRLSESEIREQRWSASLRIAPAFAALKPGYLLSFREIRMVGYGAAHLTRPASYRAPLSRMRRTMPLRAMLRRARETSFREYVTITET